MALVFSNSILVLSNSCLVPVQQLLEIQFSPTLKKSMIPSNLIVKSLFTLLSSALVFTKFVAVVFKSSEVAVIKLQLIIKSLVNP
jgi:hypothetical protein